MEKNDKLSQLVWAVGTGTPDSEKRVLLLQALASLKCPPLLSTYAVFVGGGGGWLLLLLLFLLSCSEPFAVIWSRAERAIATSKKPYTS